MWLLSNLSLWMWNIAVAWIMVDLRVAPLWVALVQAAAFLPTLLFGLPFGAVADMVDRRMLLMYLQVWFAAAGLSLAVLCLAGYLPPVLVLALTFAYGCGVAMRLPAYGATMHYLVPRDQLAPALMLNAASMNTSRVIGPLIAGALIASSGPYSVFIVIAVLGTASFLLVRSWRPAPEPQRERPASFFESMRGGIVYVRSARPMQSIMLRVLVFCGSATALPALLPLVARDMEGATPSTFTVLFSAMGVGAVLSMPFMHRLRAWLSRDKSELIGTCMHAVPMAVLAVTRSTLIATLAMVVAGAGWLMTANSLTIATQFTLPEWVRARGMAIYQMVLMGSTAFGAALFGQLATMTDVHTSLGVAALVCVAGMALAVRVMPERT